MSLRTGKDEGELAELRVRVQRLRDELDSQRVELDRELVRRAYRIDELERTLQRSRQEFESSASWRLTKPLRVTKALLRELRRT